MTNTTIETNEATVARFLADSDHVAVPVTALLDPHYLSHRRSLIGARGHGGQPADAGLPRAAAGGN